MKQKHKEVLDNHVFEVLPKLLCCTAFRNGICYWTLQWRQWWWSSHLMRHHHSHCNKINFVFLFGTNYFIIELLCSSDPSTQNLLNNTT